MRDVKDNDALSFRDLAGSASPPDNRRESRVACERWLAMMPFGDEKFASVRLLDCSRRGVGLISNKPLAVGEKILLKLKEKTITLLVYTVRNCVTESRGHRVGAELSGCIGGEHNSDDRSILSELAGVQSV